MKKYAIYSPSVADLSDDGAGFWNNDDGWTVEEGATLFDEHETAYMLPIAPDVRWVEVAGGSA